MLRGCFSLPDDVLWAGGLGVHLSAFCMLHGGGAPSKRHLQAWGVVSEVMFCVVFIVLDAHIAVYFPSYPALLWPPHELPDGGDRHYLPQLFYVS